MLPSKFMKNIITPVLNLKEITHRFFNFQFIIKNMNSIKMRKIFNCNLKLNLSHMSYDVNTNNFSKLKELFCRK